LSKRNKPDENDERAAAAIEARPELMEQHLQGKVLMNRMLSEVEFASVQLKSQCKTEQIGRVLIR